MKKSVEGMFEAAKAEAKKVGSATVKTIDETSRVWTFNFNRDPNNRVVIDYSVGPRNGAVSLRVATQWSKKANMELY